jgi:hypothetical protein
MDLAGALMPAAVVAVHRGVHGPASDQPAIELHLVGAVGCRAIAIKGFDEGLRGHRSHLFAYRKAVPVC